MLLGHAGLVRHDIERDLLTGIGIRQADDRAFQHVRMLGHRGLDLVGIDVEARDEDHVLLAVDDAQIAVVVHRADVAGAEESVRRHDFRRLVRTLPVAGHIHRRADRDLAGVAVLHLIAVVVEDLDLDAGHGQADRAGEFLAVGAVAGHAG